MPIYANNIRIAFDLDEFHLDVAAHKPGAQPEIMQSIVIHPRLAKILAANLDRLLAEYEAKFGAIPDAPKIVGAGGIVTPSRRS